MLLKICCPVSQEQCIHAGCFHVSIDASLTVTDGWEKWLAAKSRNWEVLKNTQICLFSIHYTPFSCKMWILQKSEFLLRLKTQWARRDSQNAAWLRTVKNRTCLFGDPKFAGVNASSKILGSNWKRTKMSKIDVGIYSFQWLCFQWLCSGYDLSSVVVVAVLVLLLWCFAAGAGLTSWCCGWRYSLWCYCSGAGRAAHVANGCWWQTRIFGHREAGGIAGGW